MSIFARHTAVRVAKRLRRIFRDDYQLDHVRLHMAQKAVAAAFGETNFERLLRSLPRDLAWSGAAARDRIVALSGVDPAIAAAAVSDLEGCLRFLTNEDCRPQLASPVA